MPPSIADKRATFRRLHESGCFVIPNPWDVGSALMLQKLGFAALASTSAGMAWAMGRPDNGVTRDALLTHPAQLVEADDGQVHAAYKTGFPNAPEGAAESGPLAPGAAAPGR